MPARRAVLRAGGCAAGLALVGLPTPHAAASASVVEIRMRGNADGSKVWFDPVGVLAEPGQTLRWTNEDPGNSHTSTAYHPAHGGRAPRIPAGAGPWDSDYLLPGESFELRLEAEGVYDYFCTPHEEAGMVGRIVVGRPRGSPPDAGLPGAARGLLPSAEEILRRGAVRIVP